MDVERGVKALVEDGLSNLTSLSLPLSPWPNKGCYFSISYKLK